MSYRAVVLPPAAAAFLEQGGRDLPWALAEVGEALEAARPVRLVARGGRPLGLALADPENERLRVITSARDGVEAITPPLLAERVAHALALRRGLGLCGERAAYRALHGAGDGLPGFAADVLGPWAVLYVYSRAFLAHGREIARALVEAARLRGCVVKVRSRGAASQGRVRQEIVGEPPPLRLVVEERSVPFEVHLERGLNTGLFTDMREHRHALGRLAQGRTVLNGFSYTGTLSVVAARGGAAAVTSVDLSAGVQGWARDNFRLSGLDPEGPDCRFETADVGRYLAEADRAGRRFDLVLLDPPAFSAARGAPFAIDRDYPELIAAACRLLPEGGLAWLACNARTSALVDLAGDGFRRAGRPAVILEQGGLPADHPTVPAQPQDRYLQVALFRVD
ncbi:MAG TPA: class I SAM-dependent methyltransferase [Vicinamibacteria bacterium]|nr:class I SAM-dependent methyltransferase [Vicinamibacteria bacterium]